MGVCSSTEGGQGTAACASEVQGEAAAAAGPCAEPTEGQSAPAANAGCGGTQVAILLLLWVCPPSENVLQSTSMCHC